TGLHTLSLHDALPISKARRAVAPRVPAPAFPALGSASARSAASPRAASLSVHPSRQAKQSRHACVCATNASDFATVSLDATDERSEEHTSELQSPDHL